MGRTLTGGAYKPFPHKAEVPGSSPADSRLHALKQIAKARTPAEQARAIVEHKIPYRVAASVIKHMTPTVLVALIDRMSPQELINNLGSLKRHGAFNNPDVKALIERKLEQAQTDERVSAYKAKVAREAAGVSEDVAEQLDAVTESQVKARGTVVRPTADPAKQARPAAGDHGLPAAAAESGLTPGQGRGDAFPTRALPIEQVHLV